MWKADQIKAMLTSNDRAVVRAIVALYERQTQAEQANDRTVESNGVGFNAVDAGLLSSFAVQLGRGRTLSEKQIVFARRKLLKSKE